MFLKISICPPQKVNWKFLDGGRGGLQKYEADIGISRGMSGVGKTESLLMRSIDIFCKKKNNLYSLHYLSCRGLFRKKEQKLGNGN